MTRDGRPVRFFGRPIMPRLGVIQSSIIAGVVLVAPAGLFALVFGDRFRTGSGAEATPVGSMPQGSLPSSPVVGAFVALVSAPDRTFHVESRTVVTVGGETVTVLSALDFAGPDYAGTLDVTTSARPTHSDIVVIPPVAYSRESGGPWRDGDAPQRSLDPFLGLTAGTVIADLGAEVVDGRPLRHLRLALLPVDTTFAPAVKDVVHTWTVFELWVDASGKPVRGLFTLDARARKDDKPVPVSIRSDLSFSRVGEPLVIAPPEG